MSNDDIKEILNLHKIEERIFKFKSMYHPNLVANLSKEMHDLYVIRNSIGDQLLEELRKKERSLRKINQFITDKIHEIEMKLKKETDKFEINYLKMSLDEWKAYL